MKSKKGMQDEVFEIILAVIGILILVALAVKLYNITQKTEIEKASATLDEIILIADNLAESGNENIKREALVLNPEDWTLRSIEFGSGFCSSSFCLCLCKDNSCSGQQVCKPSDSFILLRNENGEERRTLERETPFAAEMSYVAGSFYPFNNEADPFVATPLFFRFNSAYSLGGKWEWSPDLINWMGLEGTEVIEGNWGSRTPVPENVQFIQEFAFIVALGETQGLNYEEKGKEFLKNNDIGESKGAVAFQTKENE